MAASVRPSIFIRRPILSSVISIIITLAGAISMTVLPVAQYPDLVPPSVNVQVFYPGASAETISQTAIAPLEVQINGVENMLYMASTSSSGAGMGTINVYFSLGTNPDMALVNVNNKVNLAQTLLPQEVRNQGISVTKRSPSFLQLLCLYSSDDRYSDIYLANYLEINILDEVKRVAGVGDASTFGPSDYSMRVWLKPDLMGKYGLTVSDVAAAIAEQNQQFAPGRLGNTPSPADNLMTWQIDSKGRLTSVEEFENIIIRTGADSSRLLLKDIARIELGSQDYSVAGFYNGHISRQAGVYLLPGANAIATGNRVTAVLDELRKTLPDGMILEAPVDTNEFVMESIKEVIHTLVEAMILVFLVVFLFLQNWRATLIPCIAVPVSVIGTFAGMLALGYSINTLTLFGLVLAIGIVVDDAIVVLENVERIMSTEHLPPREAAAKAMHEVTSALAYRHCACAVLRVYPRVLHGRPCRPDVQAVRHHHFGVGGALGHCGTHSDSSPVRNPAQAPSQREDAQILCLVQLFLHQMHARLRAYRALREELARSLHDHNGLCCGSPCLACLRDPDLHGAQRGSGLRPWRCLS